FAKEAGIDPNTYRHLQNIKERRMSLGHHKARWFPLMEQVKIALSLLLRGEWNAVMGGVSRRLYSNDTTYILRRDLLVPIETAKAKIHICLRNLQAQDFDSLFPASSKDLGRKEKTAAAWRKYLRQSEIQKCYVAANESGAACYMQWLIGKEENKK